MNALPPPSSAVTNEDETDERLVELAATGDQSALAVLYDRYQAMVYGSALRITGDAGAAQDVVQEAFLGVWRHAGRFSSERASARTWLMAIAHHRAVDSIRRRRPTTELPEADARTPASMVLPDIWPEVAGRLDRDAVLRALATLSATQREAIELAYFGGLTQQEIAVRTDTPLGTVKSRVRLGLLALRAALTADVPPNDPARAGGGERDVRSEARVREMDRISYIRAVLSALANTARGGL